MKCFLKETYGETITRNFFYEKFFLFRPSVNLSVMAIFVVAKLHYDKYECFSQLQINCK